jgi:uncharacterized protein YcbK (DUF882 family)
MGYLSEEDKEKRSNHISKCFEQWDVEHFNPKETYRLDNPAWVDKVGADEIFPPPTMLHQNIKHTIQLADDIRSSWGGAVICVSGFRPYLYNSMIGGAESSMHQFYRALDLQPANAQYEAFNEHVQDRVERKRNQGKVIGLGLYSTFAHIDTGHYEYNRDWDRR